MLIPNEINFKPKLIKKNVREGHYLLIRGKTHQEDIAICNIYAPKMKAPTFIKETLLKLK